METTATAAPADRAFAILAVKRHPPRAINATAPATSAAFVSGAHASSGAATTIESGSGASVGNAPGPMDADAAYTRKVSASSSSSSAAAAAPGARTVTRMS